MTRLLYLCSDLGIPLDGSKGASEHVRAITRALAAGGASVSVLAARGRLPDGHPARQLAVAPGSSARQLADLIRPWLMECDENPAMAGEIAQITYEAAMRQKIDAGACDLAPDAVIERLSLFGSCGRAFAARWETPLLVEMNAPIAQEAAAYRDASFGRLAALAEERTLRSADVVMTVSSPLREHVLSTLGLAPDKVVVVPNGVDLSLFATRHDRLVVRRELGVPAEAVVFGFIGSLKVWHGVDLMLEAFAAGLQGMPKAHLLVIGDTRRTPAYRRAVERLGIERCVTFTGEIPHADVGRVLAAVDVGLAPYLPLSNFYFSPLKLYEYMAAGLCIVASRAGQITEVIDDARNGLLFEAGNVAELARCMVRAATDGPLRQRLGLAARAGSNQYGWNGVAGRILELVAAAQQRRTAMRQEASCA